MKSGSSSRFLRSQVGDVAYELVSGRREGKGEGAKRDEGGEKKEEGRERKEREKRRGEGRHVDVVDHVFERKL